MGELKKLEEKIHKRQEDFQKNRGKKEIIEEDIKKSEEKILEQEKILDRLEKIDILYKEASEFARGQTKKEIESLVTSCLATVFHSNIRFEIELGELRGKTAANFYIVDEYEGNEYRYDAKDSRGGGVVDIVSLSLRLAYLLKIRPPVKGPLILDEPAKHLSEDFIFNIANFLKMISEDFNLQIIMISHNEHISAMGDQAYRIDKEEYHSVVEEINLQ
ncbi:MAG: ATPase [Tissierellia bacterium]|nr:ATPase [Tissierellia bacterium]